MESKINIDNIIELSIVATKTDFGYLKHGNIKVNNATLISMVKTMDDKFNIELEVSKSVSVHHSILDYQSKYKELRSTIQAQLKALEPWYIGGKVGSPMDAVEALRNIDKAVNQ